MVTCQHPLPQPMPWTRSSTFDPNVNGEQCSVVPPSGSCIPSDCTLVTSFKREGPW